MDDFVLFLGERGEGRCESCGENGDSNREL